MRILILKPSSFGDIVHGLLVAERIRFQLPEARIDWVARDRFADLVEASGLVRKTYRFERSPAGFFRILRELRGEEYEAVLDFQGLARSGLMSLASRAKVKIGRFDAREGSRFFHRILTPPPPGKPPFHAVDILRQFQRPLGLYDLDPGCLEFPGSRPAARTPPDGSILLFPESRRPEKEWPGFPELARNLVRRYPGRAVALCGTGPKAAPADGPVAPLDFRGDIPVGSLPDALRCAAAIVANDSGPVHLAAAMGRPVVAVFGPTDPARFGPYPPGSAANRVVRGENGDVSRVPVAGVEAALAELLP